MLRRPPRSTRTDTLFPNTTLFRSSFLITAASLNPVARSDLDRWIAGLGNRFHVPAWVGHEVFGKISAKPELFIPMAKAAEQAIQAVETLKVEDRSAARRDGKECVSTCRSRWSPYH